jgi:Fe-S cluster biosynthesis and repair protein YggX
MKRGIDMSTLETRIQQFRQMAEADPDNELGHFSLGKAYLEADRPNDAVGPLSKALELNPRLSKAYQMLGEAYDRTAQRDRAIATLTKGVTIADEQGDRMPRDAMAEKLSEWGVQVPAFKSKPAATVSEGAAESGFNCTRCGRPGGRLPKPPFKGELGEKIHRHICNLCWQEWIGMGTKVINELGLVLSTKAGQDAYDQYMIEFLQLEDV